ncbi:hypothetical protein ACFVJM_15400 [Streptomyces virginiae]|uniref:hypothetical protein n=1 Tax=Streptomyces virginiae TaxID=1961 RepID=UPI0036394A49
MIFRVATRRDLPAVLALLADEDRVLDPAATTVGEEHERAFAAIVSDARNELLVLTDGAGGSQAGEGRRRTRSSSAASS